MSELVREALRHYERRSWWEEVNAYGRSRAAAAELTEAGVERLVDEARAGRRAKARGHAE